GMKIAVAICLPQRKSERLLEPHDGGKRKRAAAAERFFQRRNADLRLLRKLLTRHAAARDFLAHLGCDELTVLVGKLLVCDDHFPRSLRINPHSSAPNRLAQGAFLRAVAEESQTSRSRIPASGRTSLPRRRASWETRP